MCLQPSGPRSVSRDNRKAGKLPDTRGGNGGGVQWTSNDTDHMGDSATCKSIVDNDLSSSVFQLWHLHSALFTSQPSTKREERAKNPLGFTTTLDLTELYYDEVLSDSHVVLSEVGDR